MRVFNFQQVNVVHNANLEHCSIKTSPSQSKHFKPLLKAR